MVKNRIILGFVIAISGLMLLACTTTEHNTRPHINPSALTVPQQQGMQSIQAENHDECSLLVGAIFSGQRVFHEWDSDHKSIDFRVEQLKHALRNIKISVEPQNRMEVYPLLNDIVWHPYSRHAIAGIKSYCGVDFEKQRQAEMRIHARQKETFIPNWIGR